jgi:hypothetical protein
MLMRFPMRGALFVPRVALLADVRIDLFGGLEEFAAFVVAEDLIDRKLGRLVLDYEDDDPAGGTTGFRSCRRVRPRRRA